MLLTFESGGLAPARLGALQQRESYPLVCQVPSCHHWQEAMGGVPQEHRHPTFDLIAKLRARRLKWGGQTLRQDPEGSLVHQVLVAAAMHGLAAGSNTACGRSLMMDATEYSSVEELLALGRDKEGWAARVKQIGPVDHTTATSVVASLLTGRKCKRVEKEC